MTDHEAHYQDDPPPPPKKKDKDGCIVSVGQMCLLLGAIALLLA
jgi:hypothetical protein